MQFKDEGLKDELAHTPTLLQVIAEYFCQLSVEFFSIDPIVTRVLESVPGSSGVHEIGHAVDFRDEHAGHDTYTQEQRDFLVAKLHERFKRKDSKPTLLFHRFCGGPRHAHVQVGQAGITKDTAPSFQIQPTKEI